MSKKTGIILNGIIKSVVFGFVVVWIALFGVIYLLR